MLRMSIFTLMMLMKMWVVQMMAAMMTALMTTVMMIPLWIVSLMVLDSSKSTKAEQHVTMRSCILIRAQRITVPLLLSFLD